MLIVQRNRPRLFITGMLVCLLLFPGHNALAGSVDFIPEDKHSAVILAYGDVAGDSETPNSIQPEQFTAQVHELVNGGYHVIAMPAFIKALRNNDELPPRSVVITFDGAYRAALKNAYPLLIKARLPFTILYASDAANDGAQNPGSSNIGWDELKALAADPNVALGVLPASYAHPDPGQSGGCAVQINRARQSFREHFGSEAQFFAYAYGEYSAACKKAVESAGFAAALALQSGVASSASDPYALPRFSMTEKYADIERFRTIARALPLPVSDIEPADSFLDEAKNAAPAIGFTLADSLAPGRGSLACFIGGQTQTRIHMVDMRVELRPDKALENGRIRVNCTMPGPLDPDDDRQIYRWFGMLLARPGLEDESGDETGASPQSGEPQ